MTRKVNKKWMHCHLHFILDYFEKHQSPRKSTMPICYEKVTENSCRIITHIFVIYWLCLHLAQDGLWKPLHTHWNPCKHVTPLINNLKNHILKARNFWMALYLLSTWRPWVISKSYFRDDRSAVRLFKRRLQKTFIKMQPWLDKPSIN